MPRLGYFPRVKLAVLFAVVACAAPPATAPRNATTADETDGADDDPEDPSDQLPVAPPVASEPIDGHALLAEAERELAALRTSRYAHHTHVDEASGVFDFDCSGFVGYALSRISPDALRVIAERTQRPRPLAKHFEAALAAPEAPWHAVNRVDDVRPGDVITWLEPADVASRNTGHVMIAASTPHAGRRDDELVIAVIDSSHSEHGPKDTRHAGHANGLGRGEIVVVVDGARRPVAYRWSTLRHSAAHRTAIAIARI